MVLSDLETDLVGVGEVNLRDRGSGRTCVILILRFLLVTAANPEEIRCKWKMRKKERRIVLLGSEHIHI